jgi:hypothetical protein
MWATEGVLAKISDVPHLLPFTSPARGNPRRD